MQDSTASTHMLTHFVRDRTRGKKMPIEFAVRRQTKDTARLFGLNDRGTLEIGMRADLNVIDMDL
jgi:N-acyl-D-amino-acid deacylase